MIEERARQRPGKKWTKLDVSWILEAKKKVGQQ